MSPLKDSSPGAVLSLSAQCRLRAASVFQKSAWVCIIGFLLLGCASASYHSGPVLDGASVSRIQKGSTTMAEVESMLGKPSSISLMGDGRRLAMYWSLQIDSTGRPSPASFIPYVGLFASAHGTATERQQNLQIVYNASGVVEDYEFTDNTTNSSTTIA